MEETEIGEVGVDKLAERAHEKAKEEGGRAPWLRGLALSTALFAVAAAVASLESGQLANEALLQMNEATLKQAQASDAWAHYQAKGIKQVTRAAELNILSALNASSEVASTIHADVERYRAAQEESKQQATRLEREQEELTVASRSSLHHHHTFAYAVTVLQVAIALSAIAALLERRWVWGMALVCGSIGSAFLAAGLL